MGIGLRRSCLSITFCILASIIVLGGCGDDADGNGGTGGAGATAGDGGSSGAGGGAVASCPTLAESWVVEEHCVGGFVTEQIPFAQTGCSLIVAGAFSGLEGSVGENGEISLSGALGVMPYACEGTSDSSEMNLTCTENCPVRLAAQ